MLGFLRLHSLECRGLRVIKHPSPARAYYPTG